jgi:hypothetical protein
VASILLAIGLLGALEVVARSAAVTAAAADRSRAVTFARSKMEELLKEPVLQTGVERGEGVDQSTDYDWEAAIQPSANPSLVTITVTVRNRVTGFSTAISALRRPDLDTPPAGTTPEEPAGAGAGGGTL